MKSNMGTTDRIVRILMAAVIAILYFNNSIHGVLASILIIVAGIFLATGFISFCPIYKLFGINSCKTKSVG